MRNTNKKGFTIVELVVVVAVIAILAAVLIPTFSGVIAKAKLSADQKAVSTMNTAIAMEGAETLEEAMAALEKHNINAKNLIPVSAGYSFFWNDEINKIELKKAEEITEDIAESVKQIGIAVKTAASLEEAVADGIKYIKIEENIKVDSAITVKAGESVIVDLNEKTVDVAESDTINHKHYYAFDVKGELTLKNGTINARGVQTYAGANLVIEDGVTINAIDNDGGATIFVREGSSVTINGGTFKALGAKSNLVGASVVINDGGEIIINGGTFVSELDGPYVINHWSGKTTINGGTFKAARGVVSAIEGTVDITGGTFTKTNLSITSSYEVYTENAIVNITGGTFTNNKFCDNGEGSINK